MVHGEFSEVQAEFDNLIEKATVEAGQQEFADQITSLLYEKDVVVWNTAATTLQEHDRQVRVSHLVGAGALGMDDFRRHSTGLLELRGMTSSPSASDTEAPPVVDALRISSLLDFIKIESREAQVIDTLDTTPKPEQTLLVEHLTVSPINPSESPYGSPRIIHETYKLKDGLRKRFGLPLKARISPDLAAKVIKDTHNEPLLDDGIVVLRRPILPVNNQSLRTAEDVEQAVADATSEMEMARRLYNIIGALGRPLAELDVFKPAKR